MVAMMDHLNRSLLVDQLAGAALTLGLLGKILYAFPEKELFQTLLTQRVFDEALLSSDAPGSREGFGLLQSWSSREAPILSEAGYQELMLDYTRLFVGSNRVLAPLWESVYFNRERMVFQKETIQVRKWHQKYDLQLDKLHHEPDDHLGVELTFLAYLNTLALSALDQGEDEQLDLLLADQQEFLSQHPLRWVDDWSRLTQQHAKTEFYHGIALVVPESLRAVSAYLIELQRSRAMGDAPA